MNFRWLYSTKPKIPYSNDDSTWSLKEDLVRHDQLAMFAFTAGTAIAFAAAALFATAFTHDGAVRWWVLGAGVAAGIAGVLAGTAVLYDPAWHGVEEAVAAKRKLLYWALLLLVFGFYIGALGAVLDALSR